ncbi:Pyridoxal phosphate homeostasis protein, partial [Glycine soja]
SSSWGPWQRFPFPNKVYIRGRSVVTVSEANGSIVTIAATEGGAGAECGRDSCSGGELTVRYTTPASDASARTTFRKSFIKHHRLLTYLLQTSISLLISCFWYSLINAYIPFSIAASRRHRMAFNLIGNLQSNKVKPLIAAVPNLACVQTVDDEKIANLLDRAVENVGRKSLKVFVQVNTSGETSKFGVEPAQWVDLVKHITNCPNLEFCGLMTIGMLDYSSTPENFKTFSNCRSEVCKALGLLETQCELPMGMTGDFEQAVRNNFFPWKIVGVH